MELNKRKSLLTPAAPTVWGMIHGDIDNQQDVVDKINNVVKSEIDNIDVNVDLSDYYTKDEVDYKISNIDITADLTGYATESWVKQQGYITEHQDLTGYATLEYVDNQIGAINTITEDILG